MRFSGLQMKGRRHRNMHGHVLAAWCAAVLGAPATGAMAADAPRAANGAALRAPGSEIIRPGLHRIHGAGGTTLVLTGSRGPVVVDANLAGSYATLMAEIRRIAPAGEPSIGALVLTAAGPEQAGNLPQFVAAGVPVIVQRRALERLAPELRAGATAPKPFIAYDTDYLLSLGDVQVEAEHVGRGRTGADTVVFFRDLRVLAVGGLYTHGVPEPDCSSGGSFAGWAAAIAHLMYFDFDIAVPNHGPTVGKPALLALKAKLEALGQRASASPASAPASGCPPLK